MKLLVVAILFVKSVFGSYNLIETNPRCYDEGICTSYGKPGTNELNAIHPNSEERTQYVLVNMARLYPDFYRTSIWGKNIFGKYGGMWNYDSQNNCGIAANTPLYWHKDGNELARYYFLCVFKFI